MTSKRVAYTFAYLRVVPKVHLGVFVNVGVVLHARTTGYLGIEVLVEAEELALRVPHVDLDLLVRYLQSLKAIARGDPSAGPVALAPPSERFHWLTAPRSDVLQCSAVHVGVASDPARVLASLFAPIATS